MTDPTAYSTSDPAAVAALLAAAADHLDALIAEATPGPWSADPTGTVCADADLRPDGAGGEILPEDGPMEVAECYREERTGERGHNAAYIAAMDPTVGRALVAVLRVQIPVAEVFGDNYGGAGESILALARAILGEAPEQSEAVTA